MTGADEEEEEEESVIAGIHSDWTQVDRVIAKDKAGRYLVKWKGLGYTEATWEQGLSGTDKVCSLNTLFSLAIQGPLKAAKHT